MKCQKIFQLRIITYVFRRLSFQQVTNELLSWFYPSLKWSNEIFHVSIKHFRKYINVYSFQETINFKTKLELLSDQKQYIIVIQVGYNP